jgi:protein phosphatase
MTGKNNEDRYAVTAYRLSRGDPTPAVLGVLCDGIGGHRAGEVAAEVSVDLITQTVAESDGHHPVETLESAILRASNRVFAMAQADATLKGMGATCACAWVLDRRLYAATVGDSRVYLVRGDAIQQLSTDHTWIQEALDSGALTPDDVPGHPNAHIIRRYLGSPIPPKADFRMRAISGGPSLKNGDNQGYPLQPGDLVLLCSDGLTDLVKDDEILTTLRSAAPEQAVQSLIDQANAHGGHDNITVILMGVPAEAPKQVAARPRWPWALAGCAGLAVVALLVAFALASMGLLSLNREATRTPTATSTLPPLIQTALPGNPPVGPSPLVPASTPTPTSTSPFVDVPPLDWSATPGAVNCLPGPLTGGDPVYRPVGAGLRPVHVIHAKRAGLRPAPTDPEPTHHTESLTDPPLPAPWRDFVLTESWLWVKLGEKS